MLLLALLGVTWLTSCGDEEPMPEPQPQEEGKKPVITWAMASGRFRMMVNETLTLVPDVSETDETTTYTWTLEGEVVGHESAYSFTPTKAGEYFFQLTVTNRWGESKDEVKVTVEEPEVEIIPTIPDEHRLWCFPWTEINMAMGRTIKVKAYMLKAMPADATITWTLDGTIVQAQGYEVGGKADASSAEFVFTATTPGNHTLHLSLTSPTLSQAQDFSIHVCPTAGTYRRSYAGQALVNKVYELMPAPGHQVNGFIIVGDSYPENCTHEEACDSALMHFQKGWSVSLGAQGGYIVAGFDHSVENSGDYDIGIKGNPYDYQSEPGIVWVSQDDNGDGLPNDQWFELAGSEYGTDNHTTEYAITYYRPEMKKSATGWRDCFGQTGYVPYMSYWNPHDFYWQPWVEGTFKTYFGSRLKDRSTYEKGISNIPPYDWGYADNLSKIDWFEDPAGKMNHFRISDARTWDGQPANLEYIDFIKVQTAQTGSTPNLGDISTEVYYIGGK